MYIQWGQSPKKLGTQSSKSFERWLLAQKCYSECCVVLWNSNKESVTSLGAGIMSYFYFVSWAEGRVDLDVYGRENIMKNLSKGV